MTKTFVTIFPICENVHLTKDLGQIPFFLHKKFNYDSKIVSYSNSRDYSNLEGEVTGLKIDFIKDKGRLSFLEKSVMSYIYRNASKTDVLNLYIFSKYTFIYGILYKYLNPKGFLFLKLDGYNETFAQGKKVKHSTKRLKNLIFQNLEKRFISKVDLITIENTEGEKLVKQMFPSISEKIMYLPVGVNDLYLQNEFKTVKSYREKENIILTVGRIGEKIKNNEMILRALARLDLKNWKMVFVGPLKPEFKLFCDEFIVAHPQLKSKIEFTGEIADRKELYEWYNRSKIFCMASWKESFCHSIAEALYFGNFIVGTDGIMSMEDISSKGEFGATVKVDDDKAMADSLQKLIDDETILEKLYPGIITHSREKFVWSQIIEKVHNKIQEKNAGRD